MQAGNCQLLVQLCQCLCLQGRMKEQGLVLQRMIPLDRLQTCLVGHSKMAVAACHNPHLHVGIVCYLHFPNQEQAKPAN